MQEPKAPPRTERIILYGYEGCFYCSRVERAMARLGILPEYRNILRDPQHRADLVAATGRSTVPVLRLEENGETRWMPESREIVRYLQARYGDPEAPASPSIFDRVAGAQWLPWAMLIVGGVVGDPVRKPVWVAACVLMAARSLFMGVRLRSSRAGAPFHFAMAALFCLLALCIATP